MRAKRRGLSAVALVVAGILSMSCLAACGGGSSAAKTPSNGVLLVGMPNGPQTNNSNPFLESSAGASLGYRRVIFEPLVMTNVVKPTDPGKPWLATKWEWSDNFKKVVLTIRDGVTFSDGQKMTADDVAYTFQLLKDKAALNIFSIPFGDITAAGNQVTLTFPKSQYVNQNKILNTIVVPKHIWSKMKDPTTDAVKTPVGTGPYVLKTFTPQTITLVRRDGYWQDPPKVSELRYTSYTDNNAQTTALANGSAEWSFVFIPNYQAVYTKKDPQHFKLWFPPVLAVHGLWLNTERKPFDNPVLRRAMNMAINREDVVQQGEAGYFYPKVDSITGIPTPAGEPYISDAFKGKNSPVDVQGAKTLLTGNGFTYQGDKLLDPSGKPVTITLSDPAGWSDYQTDLEIIKDNLGQIGIDAKVDKANEDAWTTNVETGDFQGVLHWTNNGYTPYDMYQNMMDGTLYKPVGTGGVSGNYGRFKNQQATDALAKYADATDDTARKTALDEVQQIMVDQMPVIPLMAANAGGEYSTRHWTGWPDEKNPYAPAQPTLINALDILLHLQPAA
jgi:peptide/nickel transport system substrate-binding protein